MEKHKFLPKNIYNCDETGISTVQTPGKILATKGQKKVAFITSWERGKNITLLCAMSAAEKITPYDVAPLVRKTFNNVASISKGESGFRSTGIFPLNPEVFTEADFVVAEIIQSKTSIESLTATNTILSASKDVHSPVPSTLKQTQQVFPLDTELDTRYHLFLAFQMN
ncbi:unnamed protein product [Euphydryas editha]|uniref:Transposase n=1 Tax=Euphydryas editha TaxID=104508 RepID=A0AAU9USP5_EUPED|nr:unnamed protein product [Euphydryas editha]